MRMSFHLERASCPTPHSIVSLCTDSTQQDIITGDEIISDSYNLKEVDGVVYEADCTRITVGGENIGMHFPCINFKHFRG